MGKKKGRGRGETQPDEAHHQGGAGRRQQEPQVGRQAQPVAPVPQFRGLSLEPNSKGTYQKPKDSLKYLRPPARPDDGGKNGMEIKLVANHFQLDIGTRVKTVYHYDVEVMDHDRPMINKAMRREIVFKLLTSQTDIFPKHCCAFDGMKYMYANQKLNITGRQQYQVKIPDDEREFSVLVQWAADVDLQGIKRYLDAGSTSDIPQQAIQCLDVIMRYNQTYNMTYMPVQSSLFNTKKPTLVDLGGGVFLWFGHYQSVRMGSKLFLNVDASQKAVYKPGPVVDIMYEVIRLDPNRDPPRPGDREVDELYAQYARYLKGVKIIYQPGNRKREYRVNGLRGPANSETFNNEGRMITVQDYILSQYQLRLKYPDAPCLWVGNPNKNILVPMELCDIKPGQVMRGKLSDTQTSRMIKAAAKPPSERRTTVEAAVQKMDVASDPVANSFGFSMKDQMMKVRGRVLPPPVLQYAENQNIVPHDGKWDMRRSRFLESAGFKDWGVLETTKVHPDSLKKFLGELMTMAKKCGMAVEKPLFQVPFEDVVRQVTPRQFTSREVTPRQFTPREVTPSQFERKLTDLKQKHEGLKLVLIPIYKKGVEIYKDIKRFGDLKLNLTTQCVTVGNIDKCQQATVGNILLKINAKLGGVNNYIQHDCLPNILLEPVLILGADVTHPSPEARKEGKPSIAAVVGSSDARAMKYSGELSLQSTGIEIIEDLEAMVHRLLQKFYDTNYKLNGGKPKRIIFYRDGVSEGQFREVLRWEFNAIIKACQKLDEEYTPKITFLVVQKRHNTRLFAEKGEPTGRSGNVPPGTVVDTEIVHKHEFAYFLCSHEGIQGTSRPTHYHVLWDDNGLSSDEMQKLTYYLCHLFARCNRSVSNPAPSYYAHLLAFRGRHYHDSMIRRGNPSPQELIDFVKRSSTADSMFYV